MGDNQATYLVTDHLGSARVAVLGDNTVSELIDYTPFGDRPEANGRGESGRDKYHAGLHRTGF